MATQMERPRTIYRDRLYVMRPFNWRSEPEQIIVTGAKARNDRPDALPHRGHPARGVHPFAHLLRGTP